MRLPDRPQLRKLHRLLGGFQPFKVAEFLDASHCRDVLRALADLLGEPKEQFRLAQFGDDLGWGSARQAQDRRDGILRQLKVDGRLRFPPLRAQNLATARRSSGSTNVRPSVREFPPAVRGAAAAQPVDRLMPTGDVELGFPPAFGLRRHAGRRTKNAGIARH